MAEETRTIIIRVDASKAVDGSAAATRALERMEKAQGDAASSLDRMEKAMGRVGGYMKAQLAIMAADLAARLIQIGKNAFDAASGMGELADQLGITTRGLQALQYSAVQNGVQMAQLETGVSKFSQKLGEAAGGSKEMIESLNLMGVKILDLNGQLRPTETLMQEVAASILAIDDPAKRSAASIDFFGKAGTKFLPVLQDMAKGLDAMGNAAERGGAMISERAIVRLDQLGDAAARAGLKMRAAFANGMVEILDEVEARLAKINIGFSDADFEKGAAVRKRWLEGISDFGSGLRSALDEAALAGGRFVVTFMSYFENLPRDLPKLFVDALNGSIAAVEAGLNEIGGKIAAEFPWLAGKAGISGTAVQFGRIGGGGASTASDRFSAANRAGAEWEAGKRAEFTDFYARQKEERDRAALIARQAGFESDEAGARLGKLGAVGGGGRSNPAVKGSGDAAGDRLSKVLQQSRDEFDQAAAFAAAANRGADAIAKMEIHFKALKQAQDAFGKTAAANSNEVQDLTAKLESQALATLKLKNLGDFRADTATLREQNEILEAEVRLANEMPDIRARELATLKVMQEVKAKGLEDNKQDIADRLAVVETNERLKAQGEEIKRSTEIWTAPFKSALESIQRSTADWIDGMLQGLEQGKFSFQDFGKIGLSVLRRMASEIISLAVMRPMLGSVVNGLSSAGIISPATASSMGYGTPAGGAGGMSMPSIGGGSGLGGALGFWNRPISGNLPSGQYGPPAPGQSFSSGWMGDITWGQGLGAAAGVGMGAYQLLTANGNTGKTIGGIGSIIGAGVSLIPGIGQIAGPIISILSSIVPSLFGESNTRTHSSTNANLRYGSGGWYTTGGAYGSGANSGQSESQLRGLSGGIDSVFGLLGGIKDAGKVWGLDASSWTAQGKDWSYTSNATHLVDPSGNREAYRMNMDGMMDTGAAQVAIRSILSGAVGEISATMKTALEAMRGFDAGLKETAENIVFVDEVYERLGKGALTVRAQFREMESQFSEMTETAKKLGLSLEPVIAEQKKQTERLGQDYIDTLIDPVAQQLRAWEDEKSSILANIDYIAKHTDVIVDMARINEALLRKEAALKEQLYSGAISQLEDAIKRLTYGDLSNITGAGTLAGMQASFNATVAQARSGDQSAYQRVASEGLALTDASRGYYASSPEYEATRREILAIFSELQLQIAGGAAASPSDGSAANANTATVLNTTTQLQAMVRDLAEQLAESKRDQAETNDLIRRVLSRAA